MPEQFDIIIKNGRVIDGAGNQSFLADVSVKDGRIAKVHRNIDKDQAPCVIDVKGKIVCPGFIDTHTHDDIFVAVKPTADEKIRQGVTTVVLGNCGLSLAPLVDDKSNFITKHLGVLGGKYVPDDFLEISSLDDYLKKIKDISPGINVLSLVGHTNIRWAVMEMDNRPPTADELDKMKALTAQAMEDGAFGLSTGLAYAPGIYAEIDELIGLAEVVAKYGGLYTTHLRSEGDSLIPALAEALMIGEKAHLPVNISHHKVIGKHNWGKSVKTLEMMADARERGVAVTCDQYPYNAGSTVLKALLPPAYLSMGQKILLDKLKNQKLRKELIGEIERDGIGKWENFIKCTGFKNIVISFSPSRSDYLGKSIAEIASMEKKHPYDILFDLLIEDETETIVILYMMDEEDIIRIMSHPFTMIGTDGIPGFNNSKAHPRMTGTYPRVLGTYVRDNGLLGLEEAIRKMTYLPAQTFSLKRKGLLREGLDADITVFDPETIIDQSTFEHPDRSPQGISYVLVNGEFALKDGEIVGNSSGKVLRHI